MEQKLIVWYIDYHDKRQNKVSTKLIRQKAIEFRTRSDFIASKGWLEKFLKKYKLNVEKININN